MSSNTELGRPSGLSIGDLVTKRSGAMPFSAEVRGIFVSSRGKPLVALEYPGGIFRVVRPQQIQKVKEKESAEGN